MEQHETDQLVNQRFVLLNIICGFLLASIGIYVCLAWFLLKEGSLGPEDGGSMSPVFAMVISAIAVLLLLGAPLIARTVLGHMITRSGDAGPTNRLNSHLISVITGFGLREAVSIYGLVLSFVSGKLVWAAAFSLAAAVAMLVAWPRKETMREIARRPSAM